MTQVAVKDPRQTRERILACAERLFAERGFDVTSLRTITAEAEVNVFYFGANSGGGVEAMVSTRVLSTPAFW